MNIINTEEQQEKRYTSYALTKDVGSMTAWVRRWNQELAPINMNANDMFVGKLLLSHASYKARSAVWDLLRVEADKSIALIAQYQRPSMMLAFLKGYATEALR